MKKILVIAMAVAMIAVMSVCTFAAENIAADATVDVPFCAGWETPAAINDGSYGETSFEPDGSVHKHYGSWGSCTENTETLSYTWESEVTIDSIGLFFWRDSPDRDTWLANGGIWLPASYTIQYWNGTEYVDVANASGLAVAEDVMNVTTFDAVTTTSIQLTMKKVTDAELETVTDFAPHGLGITEWEVYASAGEDGGEGGEGDIVPAPQTGFVTVALAIVALGSGAYIVSKKH